MNYDALIIVDPQVAFSEADGSLARQHGAEEVQPLVAALVAIEVLVAKLPSRCEIIIVRSEYRRGQYCQDPQLPMYELCVPGVNRDCDLLPFAESVSATHTFVKNEHNARSEQHFARWSRGSAQRGHRHVLVCGGLLEYCVTATALACTQDWARVSVEPALCGSRATKYLGANSVVEQTLARLQAGGVRVEA